MIDTDKLERRATELWGGEWTVRVCLWATGETQAVAYHTEERVGRKITVRSYIALQDGEIIGPQRYVVKRNWRAWPVIDDPDTRVFDPQ